jgi:hypothetical protein
MTKIKWQQLRSSLIKSYGSLEKAFQEILDEWNHPTCSFCNDKLLDLGTVTKVGDSYNYHPPKHKCCLKSNCESSKINPRSKQYRIIVLGQNELEVELKNKLRLEKSVKTARSNGKFLPENNPMSKSKLKRDGFTNEEIINIGSARAQKMISTKRQNGWFDDISNNPFSKSFYTKQGMSEKEAIDKIKSKNHNCKEYWISLGFNEVEAQEKASTSADTNSLKAKVRRHGKNGLLKYKSTCKQMSRSWTHKSMGHYNLGTSKSASNLFLALSIYSTHKCYFKSAIDKNTKEWFLSDKESICFYDFTIPELKLIIEFNGEHVHPRKDRMSTQQFSNWKHAFTKESAEEVFKKDQNKVLKATNLGYNVLILWSKDEFDFNLQLAINFLKEHSNATV